MWILLAIASALCLGVYDIFKKLSLNGNNVLTVLFFNTLFGALLMSPIIFIGLSHGEIEISTILKEYNIPFEMEKTFKTCINPKTKKLLRFDFYVNNQYLIEFDGK